MKVDEIIKEVNLTDKDVFEFIHISDLHFARNSNDGPSDRYDPKFQATFLCDKKTFHKDLIETLGPDKANKTPSACIISGDLVDAGETDMMYKEVYESLTLLSNEWFGGSRERFVIIPGNHDVQWSRNHPLDQRTANGYLLALSKFYKNRNLLDNYWKVFCWDIKLFLCDNFKVLICGIDSTLIETVANRGIGYISNRQCAMIHEAMLKHKNSLIDDPNCIKIAMIHHHVLPVSHDIELKIKYCDDETKKPELTSCNPSLTYDARIFMSWLAQNNFSMVLHGHQHVPFLATEQDRRRNQKEIIVAGVGSISKIDEIDTRPEVHKSPENYFNYISVSLEHGIHIATYQANKAKIWGFNKPKEYNFPIWHSGVSVSYSLANVLEGIFQNYKNNQYHTPGTAVLKRIDLTENFSNCTISIALREVLMAFGVLQEIDGQTILKYHPKDELTLSFLKIFSRYLRTRANDVPKLFDGWLEHTPEKHKNLYSPLVFLSHLEKTWYEENVGMKNGDIRKRRYILYPVFYRQDNKLKVLLHLHEGWSIFLIPTMNIIETHRDELGALKSFPFKSKFNRNLHIEKQNKLVFENISAGAVPKPSPTRALLTLHEYDMHFYSLSINGLKDIGDPTTRELDWSWFSIEELENLAHVRLCEPEKSYQYDTEKGIFPNNLEIAKFAFNRVRDLIKQGDVKVHEL